MSCSLEMQCCYILRVDCLVSALTDVCFYFLFIFFLLFLPLDSSSLLLLLQPDVLEFQRAGDEADLTALLH